MKFNYIHSAYLNTWQMHLNIIPAKYAL